MSLNISNYGHFVINGCCCVISIAHNAVILCFGLGLGINRNLYLGEVLSCFLDSGKIDIGLGNIGYFCCLAASAE